MYWQYNSESVSFELSKNEDNTTKQTKTKDGDPPHQLAGLAENNERRYTER